MVNVLLFKTTTLAAMAADLEECHRRAWAKGREIFPLLDDIKAELARRGEDEEALYHPAVIEKWKCPGCGERRVDKLVWDDDGDHVECAACGAHYDPREG